MRITFKENRVRKMRPGILLIDNVKFKWFYFDRRRRDNNRKNEHLSIWVRSLHLVVGKAATFVGADSTIFWPLIQCTNSASMWLFAVTQVVGFFPWSIPFMYKPMMSPHCRALVYATILYRTNKHQGNGLRKQTLQTYCPNYLNRPLTNITPMFFLTVKL